MAKDIFPKQRGARGKQGIVVVIALVALAVVIYMKHTGKMDGFIGKSSKSAGATAVAPTQSPARSAHPGPRSLVPTEPQQLPEGYGYLRADTPFFSQPDRGRQVGTFQGQNMVEVVDTRGDHWLMIHSNGMSGWVHRSAVSNQMPPPK